jgi:hypothetical protein
MTLWDDDAVKCLFKILNNFILPILFMDPKRPFSSLSLTLSPFLSLICSPTVVNCIQGDQMSLWKNHPECSPNYVYFVKIM